MNALKFKDEAFVTAANDNRPPDKEVCRWRVCIDQFKSIGLIAFAVYTAKCKLRGDETFDQFADRLLNQLDPDGAIRGRAV